MFTRLLLVVVIAGQGGILLAQSLGTAAEKDKERRAKLPSPGKAYSDADLKAAAARRAKDGDTSSSPASPTPAASPAPAVSPAPGASPAANASAAPASSGSSEEAQRARGAEFKTRLNAANARLALAEAKLKTAEERYNQASQHPTYVLLEPARVNLEAARKDVEAARRVRDEIEDAARREGIPPGSLR